MSDFIVCISVAVVVRCVVFVCVFVVVVIVLCDLFVVFVCVLTCRWRFCIGDCVLYRHFVLGDRLYRCV